MKTKKEIQEEYNKLEQRLYELQLKGANEESITRHLVRIEILEWVLNY